MLPDRTKKYLFDEGFVPDKPQPKVVKAKDVTPKKSVKTDKPKFLQKLDDGLWNEFTAGDWIAFFKHKAAENGINFIPGNYAKEASGIKALMNEFTAHEIRDMMEFVWDAPHTLTEKATMGLWIFTGGWKNTIYKSSKLWREGKFVDKSKQQLQRPQREYRPMEDTIKVEQVTPTADVLPPPSKKKKSRVTI
jgi:hypothetical protein